MYDAILIELRMLIVERGFMTEEELQMLATLLNKSTCGNDDTEIKFVKLLVKY